MRSSCKVFESVSLVFLNQCRVRTIEWKLTAGSTNHKLFLVVADLFLWRRLVIWKFAVASEWYFLCVHECVPLSAHKPRFCLLVNMVGLEEWGRHMCNCLVQFCRRSFANWFSKFLVGVITFGLNLLEEASIFVVWRSCARSIQQDTVLLARYFIDFPLGWPGCIFCRITLLKNLKSRL